MRPQLFPRSIVAMIAMALALSCAEVAWAGDGGEDAGSAQAFLGGFCTFLGMSSCPQLPTVTQAVLEMAGLQNSSPGYARGPTNLGACSIAGNSLPLSGFPSTSTPCDSIALDAANRSATTTLGLSDLPKLTPLAFTINKQGQAVPTQPDSPSAAAFLYAAATGTNDQPQPDIIQLFYDYPPMTSGSFPGGLVANISLPLQVLQADGSERLVCGAGGCSSRVATLQIIAPCGGVACLAANVMGDFSTPGKLETHSAAELGIQWAVVFQTSPNSKLTHAIFQVSVPLLVTGPTNASKCGKAISAGTPDPGDCGNDPAYFGVTPANATNGSAVGTITGINQFSGLPTAFSTNVLGFTPTTFLGRPVGIAPSAAPSSPASTYPFCASFLTKGALSPAVAAFYSIGTDGTANVSANLNPATTGVSSCPL